jgi:site-specific DNA recombinase
MRALIYARVSTDAQERDGTSLETQERACVEHVLQAGWVIVECIRDTASGFTLDRPGVAQVRKLLRQGAVDVVIAYAVDRLSRNQNQIGVLFDEVEQAGARLEFVTEKFEDTAIGRFILAARAFIAEVEREKIVERTMRGKLERARSGRIPQAMGKGCFGYVYNPQTGRREIEPFQSDIVRRIFQRYAETRSFSIVSDELNSEGIPAFAGGRWYPLTIRRMLTNESYTGRLIYRRTRWVSVRGPADGKRRRRAVQRPVDEWIEIDGASPRIIEEALWQRVQQVLADPERIRRRPAARFYALRSRLKCGLCGSAMVGHTLTSKGRAYPYYGCRHAYDRHTKERCAAKYVRAVDLETGIWQEVKRVLASPEIVLQELKQQQDRKTDENEVTQLEKEIVSLQDREKRLVRLYTFGEVDEELVRQESANLHRQRALLTARIRSLESTTRLATTHTDPATLKRACAAVAAWLDRAVESERTMVLEALQIAVVATREAATVTGVLPMEPPAFAADEQSCRCK